MLQKQELTNISLFIIIQKEIPGTIGLKIYSITLSLASLFLNISPHDSAIFSM